MEAKLKVEDPGNIAITLTITLTLDSWLKLSKQLSSGNPNEWLVYPASRFVQAIDRMSEQANQAFKYVEPKPQGEAA